MQSSTVAKKMSLYAVQLSLISSPAYNHGQKILGHFCISGVFSNPHRSKPHPPPPPPHKQCWTRISRIFFRVSSLYRVGGGRTARNFRKECTVLRGNREMTETYEYCSTVPRTFVQEFLNPGFGKKVRFLNFSYAF